MQQEITGYVGTGVFLSLTAPGVGLSHFHPWRASLGTCRSPWRHLEPAQLKAKGAAPSCPEERPSRHTGGFLNKIHTFFFFLQDPYF